MCQKIRVVINDQTGEIESVEGLAFKGDETEEFLKLVEEALGKAVKAESKREYHAIKQGVKAREHVQLS